MLCSLWPAGKLAQWEESWELATRPLLVSTHLYHMYLDTSQGMNLSWDGQLCAQSLTQQFSAHFSSYHLPICLFSSTAWISVHQSSSQTNSQTWRGKEGGNEIRWGQICSLHWTYLCVAPQWSFISTTADRCQQFSPDWIFSNQELASSQCNGEKFVFLKYLSFVFLSAFLSPGKKRGWEEDLGREQHYCSFAMHNPL